MKTYSFDIFDTCLIRKCGDPQNLLDILAWHAFKERVSDNTRMEFIIARRMADLNTYDNPYAKLSDIYEALHYSHPLLKDKTELIKLEQELERLMLVPIPKMLDLINQLRENEYRIVFISDMYLPADFLANVLLEAGLMQEEDKLYVSCEVGKRKANGELFKYIQTKEHIKYRDWTHYGDNLNSDYHVPNSLGITAKRVAWGYTPYQLEWNTQNSTPKNRVAETLAGICRCLHYTLPNSSHKDFLLDLAAPLFVSFTYRVLRQAESDGIKRLYFCARDTGTIYHVAHRLQSLFPQIEIKYLYISRDALYKGNPQARKLYFEQCGLASVNERCAIVDLRTSGKTLCVLNEQLESDGYLPVRGYFFEMFCTGTIEHIPKQYYAELQSPYYMQKSTCAPLFLHHYLIEMYISVHDEKRTIDYGINNRGKAYPIYATEQTEFAEDNACMPDVSKRCEEHRYSLIMFADLFIETMLYLNADEIFDMMMCQWTQFSRIPNVYYLNALEDFFSSRPGRSERLPYVKNMGWLELIVTRGNNSIWKQASIIFSLPGFVRKWYINRLNRNN